MKRKERKYNKTKRGWIGNDIRRGYGLIILISVEMDPLEFLSLHFLQSKREKGREKKREKKEIWFLYIFISWNPYFQSNSTRNAWERTLEDPNPKFLDHIA